MPSLFFFFFSTCTHQEVFHFYGEDFKPFPSHRRWEGPLSDRGHSKCKSRAKGRWVGIGPNYLAEWFDFPESPLYPLEEKKLLILRRPWTALTEVAFFSLWGLVWRAGGDSQTICTRFNNHAKQVRGQGTWVLNISQLFEALAGCHVFSGENWRQ